MTPEQREKIIKSIKKNPNRSPSQVSDSVKGTRAIDVKQVIGEEGLSLSPKKKASVIKAGQSFSVSEEDIRKKHDPYYQIERAAEGISEGIFYTEADFRSSVVKINTSVFRRPADNEMFAKYKGRAGSVVYWGHPERIKKLKEEGVLL